MCQELLLHTKHILSHSITVKMNEEDIALSLLLPWGDGGSAGWVCVGGSSGVMGWVGSADGECWWYVGRVVR